MRSYRTLFRTPEYAPFLLSFAAYAAAQTIAGLALATLVYRATGSPLLSAVSMFGPQLAQLLGAAFLLLCDTAARTLLGKGSEDCALLLRMKDDGMAPVVFRGHEGLAIPGDSGVPRNVQTTQVISLADLGITHAAKQQVI